MLRGESQSGLAHSGSQPFNYWCVCVQRFEFTTLCWQNVTSFISATTVHVHGCFANSNSPADPRGLLVRMLSSEEEVGVVVWEGEPRCLSVVLLLLAPTLPPEAPGDFPFTFLGVTFFCITKPISIFIYIQVQSVKSPYIGVILQCIYIHVNTKFKPNFTCGSG